MDKTGAVKNRDVTGTALLIRILLDGNTLPQADQ
jgi:hypothetical protein